MCPLRRGATWYCGFNPYRVFKFVATAGSLNAVRQIGEVSIPIGFSSSLQLKMIVPSNDYWKFVSIPIGFSSSLQLVAASRPENTLQGFNPYRVFKFVATYISGLFRRSGTRFQSLSGFQVRCNFKLFDDSPGACKVSIPIGFSSSLQPLSRTRPPPAPAGFNPYRVFKFVATRRMRS